MLSKSTVECLKDNGWSSSLFNEKSKQMFEVFEKNGIELDFTKPITYLIKNDKKIKANVNPKDLNKEFLTLTSDKGKELITFHYTDNVNDMIDFILLQFKGA